MLNGLIHFPLKSVDAQHSVSFPFKSHDKRSQKSSLYCGFSTPVLPSASAQSSLAATREKNADQGKGWVPTFQMEMVSNKSPEGIFWEHAVVCPVVHSFQPVSGIVHYHTKSCYWLCCANGNFFFSIYLRVHLASSSSEAQWKRKQEVLLGSGQQRWSLSIMKCIQIRVFPQAQYCCDWVSSMSLRWENCAMPSAEGMFPVVGKVFSPSPTLSACSPSEATDPTTSPSQASFMCEHRGCVYSPAE